MRLSGALVLALLLPALPVVAEGAHVHVQGYAFPTETAVRVGDLVAWHNHDGLPHRVRADDGSFDSAGLNAGATWGRTFPAPGEFRYHCRLHPAMRGVVLVERPENARPTVTVASPTPHSTLSGLASFAGEAADADGVVRRVEVAVDDGPWTQADGGTAWTASVDTRLLANGPRVLRVRAFDGEAYGETVSWPFVAQNPHADLRVLFVASAAVSPVTHELRAMIENGGTLTAGAFDVAFSYEHRGARRPLATVEVGPLAPGASVTAKALWSTEGKLGDFPIRGVADSWRRLVELDESNNEGAGTATVLVRGPPHDARELA